MLAISTEGGTGLYAGEVIQAYDLASLGTTLPVFQRRLHILLLRLGLPGAWIQARADDLATIHVAQVDAQTADRRVLGSTNDLAAHVHRVAEAAGTFDRLDLDRLEDRLAEVLLSALRDSPRDYGTRS